MPETLSKESILAEVEAVIRDMPDKDKLDRDDVETLSWYGRAGAVLKKWNPVEASSFNSNMTLVHLPGAIHQSRGINGIIILLQQAANDLRMDTIGPVNSVIGEGGTFEYFDELRKIIGQATSDILFIDSYLDADFIPKYLPHIKPSITVRLLSSKYIPALVSAAQAYTGQEGTNIEVRSNNGLHDRYVIIDRSKCYQSGASFKDGAKNSHTTITQIADIATEVIDAYETKWTNANVE